MEANTIRAILAADVQTFPKNGAIMLNWKSFEDGSNTYSLSVTDFATNNQVIGKTGNTKPSRITKVDSKDTVKEPTDQDVDEDEDNTDTAPSKDKDETDDLGF